MKRIIILSIALTLSFAMLLLIESDSTVQAQQSQKFVSDTGILSLGSTQSLIITVVRSAQSEDSRPDIPLLQFRRMTYEEPVCNAGVCKQGVASATNSNPIQLMPGESATFRIGPDIHGNVRGMVLSNSRDVKVNSIVFDTSTMRVVSIAGTTTTMYWP